MTSTDFNRTPGFFNSGFPPGLEGRKVECPCRKCMQQIPAESLCQHMMEKHGKTTVFTSRESETLQCRFPINIGRLNGPHNSFDHSWVFDGVRFFARFQQVFPIWYAWVYALAARQEADGYFCEIAAVSAEETPGFKLRTSYVGPLHPVDLSKKEIRNKTAFSLQLTDHIVDQYKSEMVTTQEKTEGFNAVMFLHFTVWKKTKLANGNNV